MDSFRKGLPFWNYQKLPMFDTKFTVETEPNTCATNRQAVPLNLHNRSLINPGLLRTCESAKEITGVGVSDFLHEGYEGEYFHNTFVCMN